MSNSTLRKGIYAFLIVALAAGMSVVPVAAQNTTINYDADAAPQPVMTGDVEIADHQMGDSALTYNNDAGEWTELPGSVNESVDNPYEFTASDVRFNDSSAFPHAKDDVSALTAAEWSATATVSDVETADGVEAVQLDFAGSDSAQFSNFSITSDENKRTLSMVLDAPTVNAGAVVEFRVVDADGDYYAAELNTSRSSGEDFVANSTGEGYIFQRQLGEMDLTAAGDGNFNDIETLNITETGGSAATVEIAALNVDKTSAWDFGDRAVDTDDDDELESEQILEHKTGGPIAVSDLSTLGGTFESANIMGLTVPFTQDASALPAADTNVSYTDAEAYANYDSRVDYTARFELPDAYDLSYANLALEDEASLPGSRYISVEYAEGTGDTEFADISSWTDITGSYSSVGANVTVDDTLQPGSAVVLSYDFLATSQEVSSLQDTSSGAMGPTSSGSGGIIGWLTSIPGMIVSAIAGIAGFRLFKG